MNKISLTLLGVLLIAGCSTKPPSLPEPEGPLVKANINQPHEVYGGGRK
ncbi:hypothetical protein [Pseudomonas fluorescens]|nr:hypothetical protein [Pseudomonas fluorescens]